MALYTPLEKISVILIALGSNRSGAWGSPAQTVKTAMDVLAKTAGTRILWRSNLYETAGVGPGQPGVFVNGVVAIECHCSPDALLRRLKAIERMAGPRSARRWGPRTLDLDILDYRGRIIGWRKSARLSDAALRNGIVLPHALMHSRPFVLAPLAEAMPGWRHPVLKSTASELWKRVRDARTGQVLSRV